MKSIWDNRNDQHGSVMFPVNEKPITQQQYEDLVDRTNAAEEAATNAADKVDRLLEDQKQTVGTNQLNATGITAENAHIDNIQSNILEVNLIEAQNTLSATATIGEATINEITSSDAQISNIVSDKISANEATLDNIKSQSIETENLKANSLELNRIDVENGAIKEFNSDSAAIGDLVNAHLDTSEAEIEEAKIDDAEIDKAKVRAAEITHQDTTYITHLRDPQEITEVADTGDFYILLPQFTNGFYYLEMRNDTGKLLASFEVWNSLKNIMFKWSMKDAQRIIDFKMVEDAYGAYILQVHCNALNEHITLYRQSQSTSNTDAPTIYDTDQFPSTKPNHSITDYSGTYIQDVIFTNRLHIDCLEMDALFMDCVGIYKELWLTDHYEDFGDGYRCQVTSGEPQEYIANEVDPVSGIVHPRWQKPSDYPDSTDKCLIPSCAVAKYTGEEYAGTADCDIVECKYPIVHLGDNTCVHGSADVRDNLKVSDKAFVGNAADMPSLQENSLVVNESGIYRCNADENGDPVLNEVLPYDAACAKDDQKPIIYNGTTNALQTSDKLDIECLDVDNLNVRCCANVGMDLTVGGDLYVRGTTHTTESSNISTGADIITLRQNNPSGLATGEASGIIIHNYNGANNLAVVVDNTGTLRIGDVSGTESTYDDIYYKDGLWYSDEDATVQITPAGELTAYSEKIVEHDNPITHYKNAVFTDFSYDDLSPVLGRNETSEMVDNSLLIWDAASWEAKTIELPTVNGSSLFYDTENDTYYWKLASGSYKFQTMADYEAVKDNIQVDSLVMIADEDNYLTGKGDNLIIDLG